jgi:hypothetical protein
MSLELELNAHATQGAKMQIIRLIIDVFSPFKVGVVSGRVSAQIDQILGQFFWCLVVEHIDEARFRDLAK